MTGLFGTRHSIARGGRHVRRGRWAPAAGHRGRRQERPQLTGDHLTPDDEAALRRHYGVGQGRRGADRRAP